MRPLLRSEKSSKQKLAWTLAITLLGLFLPLTILLFEGYDRLRKGQFFHDRSLAQEFVVNLERCLDEHSVSSETLLKQPQLIKQECLSLFKEAKIAQRTTLVLWHNFDELFVHVPGHYEQPVTATQAPQLTVERGSPVFFAPLSGIREGLSITIYSTTIPRPGGKTLVGILFVSIVLVVPLGLLFIYFIGSGSIEQARERANFAAAVTHELKSPLAGLRLHAELISDKYKRAQDSTVLPDISKHVAYIELESQRLAVLVDNILELTKGNARQKLPLQDLSARALLEEVKNHQSGRAESLGFHLEIEVPQDYSIRTNHDAVIRILENLVDNALKFAQNSEPKKVVLGVVESKTFLGKSVREFMVRDFGPGIKGAEKYKIFKLFYRSEDENTRKSSGTGIGLALAKSLAARMGARLIYRSAEPGSCFVLQVKSIT